MTASQIRARKEKTIIVGRYEGKRTIFAYGDYWAFNQDQIGALDVRTFDQSRAILNLALEKAAKRGIQNVEIITA